METKVEISSLRNIKIICRSLNEIDTFMNSISVVCLGGGEGTAPALVLLNPSKDDFALVSPI